MIDKVEGICLETAGMDATCNFITKHTSSQTFQISYLIRDLCRNFSNSPTSLLFQLQSTG